MMLNGTAGKPMADVLPGDKRRGLVFQIVLRSLAAILAAAAIPVMVTSDRDVLVYGIDLRARYSYFAAFKFMIVVDSIVCAFSLASLLVVCRRCVIRSESGGICHFLLYFHDTVMLLLTMAGCSAAAAVGYIGYYGVEEIGWTANCNSAGDFCVQILTSVTLTVLVFFSYLALVWTTAYKFTAY